jgi:hypothetical protein
MGRICVRARVFSLRALLLHTYKYQAEPHERLFLAFFRYRRDAMWCLNQVNQRINPTLDLVWPPLASRPTTEFRVLNLRNLVYIPVTPRFTDPTILRTMLSLYLQDED